jgi:ribosomal protein L37AE/L43A
MSEEDRVYLCTYCNTEKVEYRRWKIGLTTCLGCGEHLARRVKHTIAPMHKSNYMLISNLDDLRGLNNKGGLIK